MHHAEAQRIDSLGGPLSSEDRFSMYRSTSLFVLLLAKETAVTKYTTTASNAHAQALITMHTTRRAMGRRRECRPPAPRGPRQLT